MLVNHDVPNADLVGRQLRAAQASASTPSVQYWEDQFHADFPIGASIGMTTYFNHRFFIRDKSSGKVRACYCLGWRLLQTLHGPWVVPNKSKTWKPVLRLSTLSCTAAPTPCA